MTDRNRTRVLIALLLPVLATGSAIAATPTPKQALAIQPIQADVDYDVVPAAAVDQCRVIDFKENGEFGWRLIGPDGNVLRRFVDTNDDKRIDLWCYFRFGVEVYRDIDADHDGKADQYRWLNTGGTRWGFDDNEDGKIDRWKRISAEEVSAEVVAAFRDRDADRFAPLLIAKKEIDSLGLGEEKAKEVARKAANASRDFARTAARQTTVGENANWVQFAASSPGIVPAGTQDSTKDVLVYENAVAMFEQGDESSQLIVGTLIRVGDTWRIVELPSLGTESQDVAQSTGIFFTPGGFVPDNVTTASAISGKIQELVTRLEKVDERLNAASPEDDVAQLHESRADTIEQLIEEVGPNDRGTWVRQLVDTLTVASQTGAYPDGAKRLRSISRRFGGTDKALKAYADFQAIGAEYIVRQSPKDADFAKVQAWYLDALTGFVDRYPDTAEAAQAWLQLGLSKEFEDKEKEAIEYYKKVADAFTGTDPGRKAAGALLRLQSVGRRVDLEGQSVTGKPFRLSSLRGRAVVLHYWATWCEPCKQDMKLLRQLQTRYGRGLGVVGVNVDQSREAAIDYIKQAQIPWTQLYAPGGLESSPLASKFGVQTLPTMLLIDKEGKVVRHNIRASELEAELDKLIQPRSRQARRN